MKKLVKPTRLVLAFTFISFLLVQESRSFVESNVASAVSLPVGDCIGPAFANRIRVEGDICYCEASKQNITQQCCQEAEVTTGCSELVCDYGN